MGFPDEELWYMIEKTRYKLHLKEQKKLEKKETKR